MLTEKILKPYFTSPNNIPHHIFYDRSVEITNKLEAHSKGKYPKNIIEMARPNETFDQKQYRKTAFTPVTQTYFSKVVSTISKISRADDFTINFPEQTGIDEKETLEEYTCDNYPSFDTVLNWFFSLQLREMCDDPNGVVAVFPFPKVSPDNDSEYLKPFTFWFESDDVIDYKEGELAVLRSAEKSIIYNKGNACNDGLVYYVFDKDSWTKCIQVGEKDDYTFIYDIQPHWIGHVPCFKIGGIIEEFKNGEMLYDSFIGDCLPFWNEALRRYSDLQVQMVLHVHSEKWEIEDTPCKTCNGSGQVANNFMGGGRGMSGCGSCGGRGTMSVRSPFGVKIIKPAARTGINESINIPTPPMDYIRKPIEESRFIDEQMMKNIQNGLAAINMEFLSYQPEVNSGIAKTMDRQEMNSFFYTIARHIVKNVLQPTYYFISKWRYGLTYSEQEIMSMQPDIKVPTNFDILNQDMIVQRLTNAKAAGVSSRLMSGMEVEFAKKEFGENSLQVQVLINSLQLDPLPNISVDEKMTVLSNKGCSREEYILSSKLSYFINRAISEDNGFLSKTYSEKKEILNIYVTEDVNKELLNKIPLMDNNGNTQGGGLPSGDNIETPVDIEAEAKARLKGSVGGVQGILQIQASVAQGITSLDAAIVLLQEIYGFDPSTSKKMLGSVKKKPVVAQ